MSTSFRDPILLFNYYPRTLIRMLETEGISASATLRGTQIDYMQACQDSATCITYSQYGQMIFNALRLTGDPALGLRFGQALNITQHGLLGIAAMSSPTLGDALAVLQSHYVLLSPVLVLELKTQGEHAVVQANAAWPLGPLQPFAIECLFSGLYQNCCHILNLPQFPCRVAVAYTAPDYAARYNKLLPCPVVFNYVANQIMFPVECLQYPLPFNNPTLHLQCLEHCRRMLVTLQDQESLVLKLRALPMLSDQRVLSVEQAAQALHISSRTLRRQLSQLGTNYQAILDRVRAERAVELLDNPANSVTTIAERLHFQDTANFRKAFRRWFNTTPQHYRQDLNQRENLHQDTNG